ncbi:MAG: ABC transporter ATP-binding protein [Acidimicrobiales bacterium]
MTNAIEVHDLTKSYGDLEAVRGIDLTVAEGEILAFLGPNGAGKTTTIEILEGFRDRTSGEVRVLGEDPATASLAWRDRIGIVLQESEPVAELTARESLAMQAGYYSSPRSPDELLSLVGLSDSANQRTKKLSGGQRRRLDLAMALVGDPTLVFLDEPTTGFDPSARRESWKMIKALRQHGRTVLLTTHYMDEAEQLADRIVVIANGLIVARGTTDELADQVQATTQISWVPAVHDPMPPELLGWQINGAGQALIGTADVLPVLHELTSWATDLNVNLPELNVRRPTLEDVYLELTRDRQSR